MCESLFLVCALALPSHTESNYVLLKKFIEARKPDRSVVFINHKEHLLNPGAEDTGITVIHKRERKGNSLKIWLLPAA